MAGGSFLSSRPNWLPHPLTRQRVLPYMYNVYHWLPSRLVPGWGGVQLLGGEGLEGSHSDEGTDTLVLKV